MILRLSLAFVVLMGSSQVLFAQSDRSKKLAEKVWSATDKYADITEVPDKSKDASAVILYQEFLYDYDQQSNYWFRVSKFFRRRLKLQDIKAVEQFSELSFEPNAIVGARVVKPDGTVRTLDVSKAIETTGDNRTMKKMPIEDLSLGDIIDYYRVYDETVSTSEEFEPIIALLSGDYPIVEQRLVFLADKKFHFTFHSLNGAPEIQPLSNSDREIAYYLVDKDRAPRNEERWAYEYLTEPTLKFKMLYLANAQSPVYERGQKSGVLSKTDVRDLISRYHERTYFYVGSAVDEAIADTSFATELDKIEFIYAYLRKQLLLDEVRNIRISEGTVIPNVDDVGLFNLDIDFVNRMAAMLRNMEIEYDVIVAMPSTVGTLDEILMTNEMSLLLQIQFDSVIYIARPTLNTVVGQIPSLIEGTDAYALHKPTPKAPMVIREIRLPLSSHTDNLIHRDLYVRFNEQMDTAAIRLHTVATGQHKDSYQSTFLTLHDQYKDDGGRFYRIEMPYKKEPQSYKENRAEMAKHMEKFQRQDSKLRLEQAEAMQASDRGMEISTYDKFTLISPGRYRGDDAFRIEEEFTTTALLGKAGKNYTLEIGKLMGAQIGIKEDELTREVPVYMPFPRSFKDEITIEIPKGYKVSNLDKLNVSVTNSTGGFIASGSIDAGQLQVSTYKYYTGNFEPVEKWPDIVAFLNAAYDFSQLKVLLVPE